ncbi:MAG: DUF3426 domain-containing protein [Pseudomonadota bacterium]
MALATRCPHCHTLFRVANDQLKLRGGIVRCGACNEIFDGNASLITLDSPAARPAQRTPAPSAASVAPASAMAGTEDGREPSGGADEQPVYTLDFATAFDPLGILPKPEAEEEPAPASPPTAPEHSFEFEAIDLPPEPQAAPAPQSGAQLGAQLDDLELDLDVELDVNIDTSEPDTSGAQNAAFTLPPAPPHVAQTRAAESSAPEDGGAPHAHDTVAPSVDGEALERHAPAGGPRIEPTFGEVYLKTLGFDSPGPDEDERTDSGEGQAPPRQEGAPLSRAQAKAQAKAQARRARAAAGDADGGDDDSAIHVSAHGRALAAAEQDERSPDAPVQAEQTPGEALPLQPDPQAAPAEAEFEPSFVKRSRMQQKFGRLRSAGLALGSLLLVAALLAQGVTNFRNRLAAQFPQLKSALVSACGVLGCRVELPSRIDVLNIDLGELQTLGGGAFSYITTLRNQGSLAQSWPHVELALTENDKPVLRRVFTPAEYQIAAPELAKGIGGRSEQVLKLYFKLDEVKASGYHVAIFYP